MDWKGSALSDNSVKTGKWSDGEQSVVETDGVREVSDDEMTRSRVLFLLCVGKLIC